MVQLLVRCGSLIPPQGGYSCGAECFFVWSALSCLAGRSLIDLCVHLLGRSAFYQVRSRVYYLTQRNTPSLQDGFISANTLRRSR